LKLLSQARLKEHEEWPEHLKGAFTLGVRDSRVDSPNTMLAIWDLNLIAMKFYVKLTFT
jgi:hypothetical protein